MATAGDVNGDGFADVIVGAYSFDNGQTDEGRAFVYRGSAGGLATTAAWTAESDQGGAQLGVCGGDGGGRERRRLRGRHRRRVLLRQRPDRRGARVRLPRLGGGRSRTAAAWTAESDQAGAVLRRLGGDGGRRERRRLRRRHRRGRPTTTTARPTRGGRSSTTARRRGSRRPPAWTAEGDQADAQFGCSVATAGDVNGDGYADVIVGATDFDNGQTDEGRAFVYHGSAAGLAHDRRLDGGEQPGRRLLRRARWRRRGT